MILSYPTSQCNKCGHTFQVEEQPPPSFMTGGNVSPDENGTHYKSWNAPSFGSMFD